MKLFIAKNINQYINIIMKIKKKEVELWYRGQPSAKFKLLPSIMRERYVISDNIGEKIEPRPANGNEKGEICWLNCINILNKFKAKAESIVEVKPQNDLEWLCLAQHYNLKTPLLDWSTDPLIALYFACNQDINDDKLQSAEYAKKQFKDYEYTDTGAIICVINPIKINRLTTDICNKQSVILNSKDHCEYIMNQYIYNNTLALPSCIYGSKSNKRICRQSGNFTIQGHYTKTIDNIDLLRNTMYKIFIPYNAVNLIKKQLECIDLTENSIYFGKDKKDIIAKEILNDTIPKFRKEIGLKDRRKEECN